MSLSASADAASPDIQAMAERFAREVAAAPSIAALEAVRVEALGRNGAITRLMKSLGAMAAAERLEKAPSYQQLREQVASAIEARRTALEAAALAMQLAAERLDLSLPVAAGPTGHVHPVAQVMDELAEIFADLGFGVAEGPEIEDDWHNFTALNIPPEHPARAMHDTFYVRPAGDADPAARRVLRTHTSPVQIRTMVERGAPLRIIAPGRVYRADSDATHTPMFHQIEGLVIDRGVHLGHLKWTLETFVRAYFELDDVVLRLRPSFFPFTEPSVEVDVGCQWTGRGSDTATLKVGGTASWLEILGAGMVHPRVLANCGLDPDTWQGFAFGCGIDRLAMLKYGMTDLRAFFDADLRWLAHYGFSFLDTPTLSAGVGA